MSILILQSSRWGRELVALLNLSSWCLVMVEGLFLMVPLSCLQFLIVVFPDHTHFFLTLYALMDYSVWFDTITLGRPIVYMSRDMRFPTMWHFDKCRLRRACAASL